MAKIVVQVSGGLVKEAQASTVGEVKDAYAKEGVKYTATVGGDPAADDQELNDYDFVTLTENVKGA